MPVEKMEGVSNLISVLKQPYLSTVTLCLSLKLDGVQLFFSLKFYKQSLTIEINMHRIVFSDIMNIHHLLNVNFKYCQVSARRVVLR